MIVARIWTVPEAGFTHALTMSNPMSRQVVFSLVFTIAQGVKLILIDAFPNIQTRKQATMKSQFYLCLVLSAACVYGQHDGQKAGSAATKLTVAITDFIAKGLAEGEPTTLTDAFRSYLINTGRFRVMERGQMDAILQEQGFQQSGACTDQACMVEMGQLLGVDNILAGSVGKVGATYSINVRLVSVKTGEIIRSANRFHKGEIDGLLTEVLPNIAVDMCGPAVAESQPTPPPAQATVAAAAPMEKPEPKKEEIKPKKKRRGGLIVLGIGVVAAGGGVAAFLLTRKDDTSQPPQTGEVMVTWE